MVPGGASSRSREIVSFDIDPVLLRLICRSNRLYAPHTLRAPLARALASAGLAAVRSLLRDRYPLADQLARVQVPTTVVYGSRDSIVPPQQSRAVAAAAAGETRVVEIAGADHNDPALLDGKQLIEAVVELAELVCQPPRTRRARRT